MKKTSSTSQKKVKVLNKNGHFASLITVKQAKRSVQSDKSKWVSKNTVQLQYHHQDLKQFKKDVLERDSYTCYLCGLEMDPDHPLLTVDHVTPIRQGGSILPHNMRACCKTCNEQKGHRNYRQYFLNLYGGLMFMLLWRRKQG